MVVGHAELKRIEDITVDVLRGMKVSLYPEVSADAESVRINLVGEDSAIIIGFHGETLADFSYILGIILRGQLDKNFILRVDAGGYMKDKDERIQKFAEEAISKVQSSGFPEKISSLNSYERRLVHSAVEKAGLSSESTGAGKDRTVVIKPITTSSE